MKWSSQFPTKKNAGQWFFVKHDGKDGLEPVVRFKKVRLDEKGRLFLRPESDNGIHKDAYGTPLDLYQSKFTQFIGPIEVPRI